MSNDINAIVQQLREAAKSEIQIREVVGHSDKFFNKFQPEELLSVLDALEAAQKNSARWFNAFQKSISVGARYEERIAELEQQLAAYPVVPDAMKYPRRPLPRTYQMGVDVGRVDGWNACRAAMLSTSPASHSELPHNWIKSCEQTPQDKEYVWCWGIYDEWDKPDGFEGYYDATRGMWFALNNGDYVDGGYGGEYSAEVTHWMPMPAAPAPEGE